MQCKECGKWTISDDGLCSECRAKKNGSAQPEVYHNPHNTRVGFKTALASVILPIVAVIVMFIALIGMDVGLANAGTGQGGFGADVASVFFYSGVLFAMAGVYLAVVSVIYSVKSILTYRNVVKWGSAEKPVATLVLGIVGSAESLGAAGFAVPTAITTVVSLVTFFTKLIYLLMT